MAGFKFKLSMSASPLRTLQLWATELRKAVFILQESFKFGSWQIEIIGGATMTTADLVITYAEYLKIWEFVWYRFDITFTTATAANPYILVKPPVIPAYPGSECFPAWILDGGVIAGIGLIATSFQPSWLIFQKYDASNWSNASDLKLVSSGFYRASKPGDNR